MITLICFLPSVCWRCIRLFLFQVELILEVLLYRSDGGQVCNKKTKSISSITSHGFFFCWNGLLPVVQNSFFFFFFCGAWTEPQFRFFILFLQSKVGTGPCPSILLLPRSYPKAAAVLLVLLSSQGWKQKSKRKTNDWKHFCTTMMWLILWGFVTGSYTPSYWGKCFHPPSIMLLLFHVSIHILQMKRSFFLPLSLRLSLSSLLAFHIHHFSERRRPPPSLLLKKISALEVHFKTCSIEIRVMLIPVQLFNHASEFAKIHR